MISHIERTLTWSQVVDKDSGILNLQNETSAPMTADHHTVCKFSHREDPGYRDVRNVLKSLVFPFREKGEHAFGFIIGTSAYMIQSLGISPSTRLLKSKPSETYFRSTGMA